MKTILYLGIFLLCFASVSAQTGTPVGSITYAGSKDGETFIEFRPKNSIRLKVRAKKQVIVSDENGDYIVELPIGKYCIYSIKNENGMKMQLEANQQKCFKTRENKFTRFDIMLLF